MKQETKDQKTPKELNSQSSHSQPVDNQIVNSLLSNQQNLKNNLVKLNSSQSLLVNKVHNLEALVQELNNEYLKLTSQLSLNKTTPSK